MVIPVVSVAASVGEMKEKEYHRTRTTRKQENSIKPTLVEPEPGDERQAGASVCSGDFGV